IDADGEDGWGAKGGCPEDSSKRFNSDSSSSAFTCRVVPAPKRRSYSSCLFSSDFRELISHSYSPSCAKAVPTRGRLSSQRRLIPGNVGYTDDAREIKTWKRLLRRFARRGIPLCAARRENKRSWRLM